MPCDLRQSVTLNNCVICVGIIGFLDNRIRNRRRIRNWLCRCDRYRCNFLIPSRSAIACDLLIIESKLVFLNSVIGITLDSKYLTLCNLGNDTCMVNIAANIKEDLISYLW